MVRKEPHILMVATTASMIAQFNLSNIKLLKSLGAEVHVATNFENPGTITKSHSDRLKRYLRENGIQFHQVDFKRGLGNPIVNRKCVQQLCRIIEDFKIDGIHTHSPLGSIIARRAGKKMGVKVVYTAHGFQFFPGGPILNWLLFFPVEWFYAHWTDSIITINSDDYRIAKKFFDCKTYYIPGVGSRINDVIDLPTSEKMKMREKFRGKFSISNDDVLIISVGELSKRKNHLTVLKSLKKINSPKIKYMIAGIGPEQNRLTNYIEKNNLQQRVKLLGYVNDLNSLYFASDLNIFISLREGLGLGGLDGVAHGSYIIGNGRTGMKDYILSEDIGLMMKNPKDVNELVQKIRLSLKNLKKEKPEKYLDSIRKFDTTNVNDIMKKIYMKEFFGGIN